MISNIYLIYLRNKSDTCSDCCSFCKTNLKAVIKAVNAESLRSAFSRCIINKRTHHELGTGSRACPRSQDLASLNHTRKPRERERESLIQCTFCVFQHFYRLVRSFFALRCTCECINSCFTSQLSQLSSIFPAPTLKKIFQPALSLHTLCDAYRVLGRTYTYA